MSSSPNILMNPLLTLSISCHYKILYPNPYFVSLETSFNPLDPSPPEDMHNFLTCSHKYKFIAFKNCSVVPIRVVNLHQLKEAHFNVSSFFKFQDLSTVFCLYVLKVYEDPVSIFYANLCLFPNSGELETLMIDIRIILKYFLFE